MSPYIYITVPSYFALACIGGLITLIFLDLRIEKYEIEFCDFLKIFIASAIGCFLGAKLLSAITTIAISPEDISLFQVPGYFIFSGYVFYGGFFGALAGIRLVLKKMPQYSWRDMRNFIAPAFPLFHSFGRIGCFLAGCCYGMSLDIPVTVGGITFEVIPTQLIESCFEISIFSILFFCERKNKVMNYLKFYLISYAVFRFVIEFVRADMDRGYFLIFSTSQYISIAILVYYIYKKLYRKE